MTLSIGIPSRRSPLVRGSLEQLAIPMPPQPRPARKETPRVYAAILVLRRRGCVVYRRGESHYVDGRQLTSRELLKVARP